MDVTNLSSVSTRSSTIGKVLHMNAQTGLVKSIGLREAITLTVGTVIGVGLFTVGSNVVGTLGKLTILATFVALLVSIYPALIYAEMGAALPHAGGTYHYAKRSMGSFWGMQAGWSFVISLIAVASGEALAFSFYFKTLFEAIGIPLDIDDRIIAISAISLFIFVNYRGIRFSGKIQNGLMFFFWGVAIVWMLSMLNHVNWDYFKAVVPIGGENGITISAFIIATGLVWWCFAGFETCCAMGSEIRHPHINIPRALILAPFIIFIVTSLFQWFLVGIVSPENLGIIESADAPYAVAMKQAGILGFPLILLCLGITFGGDFSTMNPAIAAPSRYLFTLSEDGFLPKIFSRVHPKYKSPYVAVLFVGIVIIGLIYSADSMLYIASLSLFADLFYYLVGLSASIVLRIRRPDLNRPFRLKGLIPGAVFSIFVYLILMSQLEKMAFITGAVWCAVGAIIYFVYAKVNNKSILGLEPFEQEVPSVPTESEQKSMDQEFGIWRIIVFVLFVGALALYAYTLF